MVTQRVREQAPPCEGGRAEYVSHPASAQPWGVTFACSQSLARQATPMAGQGRMGEQKGEPYELKSGA